MSAAPRHCCRRPVLVPSGPSAAKGLLPQHLFFLACLFGHGSAVGDSPAEWQATLSGFGSGSGPQGKGRL